MGFIVAKLEDVAKGDKVKTNAEYDWNGVHLASFVRETVYDVQQVGAESKGKEYIVIGLGETPNGHNTTAGVHVSTLTIVKKKNAPNKNTKKASNAKPKEKSTNDMVNDIMKSMDKGKTTSSNNKMNGDSGAQTQTGIKSVEGGQKNEKFKDLDAGIRLKRRQEALAINAIEKNSPKYVQWQNEYNFPYIKEMPKSSNGNRYIYDYYMDYWKDLLSDGKTVMADMKEIYQSINTDVTGSKLYHRYITHYNKYKIAYGDDFLSKTFAHIFFVKPDCNIGTVTNESTRKFKLLSSLENIPEFYYANRNCPDLLGQLTQSGHFGDTSDFMMYLSNKARSFEVSDEHIMSDTYGQGLTGYKIPYGKDNVASKTADKFSISYIDDRNIHIYHLHKLWIDYISYVHRGKLVPTNSYNINKVIDYATSVYYLLCAEDGETVIFWSKYWGVFPLDAPSSAYSYTADNPGGVAKPELKVEYQYAWKEDFNPLILVEFNENSRIPNSSFKYTNTYQSSKLGTGYSWSPRPFIETFKNPKNDAPYTFKLRFTPSSYV